MFASDFLSFIYIVFVVVLNFICWWFSLILSYICFVILNFVLFLIFSFLFRVFFLILFLFWLLLVLIHSFIVPFSVFVYYQHLFDILPNIYSGCTNRIYNCVESLNQIVMYLRSWVGLYRCICTVYTCIHICRYKDKYLHTEIGREIYRLTDKRTDTDR